MTCGADTLGTSLNNSLTYDVPYNTPDVPLNGAQYTVPDTAQLKATIVPLYNSNLTEGKVDGTGTFDVLMAGFSAHLQEEYKRNRITGAEYTKAFIALTEVAMAQGASYLLQKESLYWDSLIKQQQAQLAEVQVATSRIKLETAKVEHTVAQLQALNLEADYATKKLQMANLSSQFCISEYELNNMLPRKLAMLNSQITGQLISNDTATWNLSTMLPSQHVMVLRQTLGQELSNDTATWNLSTMLPAQHTMLLRQTKGQELSNDTASYNLLSMMPVQKDLLSSQLDASRYNVDNTLPAQLNILKEQYEATRAQTLDTRSNGTAVDGTLGGQRKLHAQQVTSYVQDTRIKVAKMYSDMWITYITINDEALTSTPLPLKPDNIALYLENLRQGVVLG